MRIDEGKTVVLANQPLPLSHSMPKTTSYLKYTSPESPPKGGDVEAQMGL